MFNVKVDLSDLPTPAQLFRSSVIAAAVAALLSIGVVLPAEYGVDPTGMGRLTGLTEMGEIKVQLAKEAAADRALDREQGRAPTPAGLDKRSGLLGSVLAELWVRPAVAQTAPAARTQEMSVTLKPNEGAEIKLDMKKGAKASYAWSVSGGGNVNYDMHGEPHNAPNSTHSYKKGRFTEADKGVLEAKFDGNHGWFWRNRSGKEVTVTVRAEGDFGAMKRVL